MSDKDTIAGGHWSTVVEGKRADESPAMSSNPVSSTSSSFQSASSNSSASNTTSPDGQATGPDLSKYNFGAYSPSQLSRKAWEQGLVPWSNSAPGRLAIRTFSRGIMGAVFFASGNMLISKWMRGGGKNFYDKNKSWSELNNPLQYIAKLVDTTLGEGWERMVTGIAGEEAGKASVTFRPTARYLDPLPGPDGKHFTRLGRSWGDEIVSITFDFFMASVGDAWGRDIAGWFDPAVKKDWMKDGHFDFSEAVKSTLKAVTRYVFVNGGEDWFVAAAYSRLMHDAITPGIDKAFPGFKYDYDAGLNGSSYRVKGNPYLDAEKKHINPNHRPEIDGTYALAGALDLQLRFTAYNGGTNFFRREEKHLEAVVAGKKDNIYGDPDAPEPKGIIETAVAHTKALALSMVKGFIYMTPAVPFFWITRTTQKRGDSFYIHPEHGRMGRKLTNPSAHNITGSDHEPLRSGDGVKRVAVDSEMPTIYYAHSDPNHPGHWIRTDYMNGVANPNTTKEMASKGRSNADLSKIDFYTVNPHSTGNTVVDKIADATAVYNSKVSDFMGDKFARFIPGGYLNAVGATNARAFTTTIGEAISSYLPYMYTKGETSLRWDNGKTDLALEHTIDGAANLNPGQFFGGLGETWQSFWHKPFHNPQREAEAQRRTKVDTTPPDIFTETQSQMEDEEKAATSHWRDRIISGNKSSSTSVSSGATSKTASSSTSESKDAKKSRAKSHVEQQALRQALNDYEPPTKSVH